MYQIDTEKLTKFFENLSKADKAEFAEALGFKCYQKEEGYIVPTVDDFDDSFANQLDKDDKWALLAFMTFVDTFYVPYLNKLIGIDSLLVNDDKLNNIYDPALLLIQDFRSWDYKNSDFDFKKLEDYITYDRFDKGYKYLEISEIGIKDKLDNVLARFKVTRQLDESNQRIYKVKTWLLDGNEIMAVLDLSRPDNYFSRIASDDNIEKFCRFFGIVED